MEQYRRACQLLPEGLRRAVMDQPLGGETEELRLRVGLPLFLSGPWGERPVGGTSVEQRDLEAVVDRATGHSRYAASDTLRQGYLTAEGGFRVGLCGTASVERGRVDTFRSLSSLAIRIPRQRLGAGEKAAADWMEEGMPNLLILGPPGRGKTTLMRDMVRCVYEAGHRVGLADERGELAAVYRGLPQLEVGPHTDVMEGCPKELALTMLLRTMTPRVLAVDEVATREEAEALELGYSGGAALLATAHAADGAEAGRRAILRPLLQRGVFRTALVIRGEGRERRYEREELPWED